MIVASWFAVSEQDGERLRRMSEDHRHRLVEGSKRGSRNTVDPVLGQSRGFHVVRVPSGGIPALTEEAGAGIADTLGRVQCDVYRAKLDSTVFKLRPISPKKVWVHNLSLAAVTGNTWALVAQDKLGDWYVIPTGVSSGGGGDLVFKGFRVTLASALSVSNNTLTTITWTSETYDPNGFAALPSSDFTLTAGSIYLVVCSIYWSANTTGTRRLELLDNAGGVTLGQEYRDALSDASFQTQNHLSVFCRPIGTFHLRARVTQDSGGALNANTSSSLCVTSLGTI